MKSNVLPSTSPSPRGFSVTVSTTPPSGSQALTSRQRTVSIKGKMIGFMMRAFDKDGNDAAGTFGPASHPLPTNTMLNEVCMVATASVCHAKSSKKQRDGRRRLLDDGPDLADPLEFVFEAPDSTAASELQFVVVAMEDKKDWDVVVPTSQDPAKALSLLQSGYSDSKQLAREGWSFIFTSCLTIILLLVGGVVTRCLKSSARYSSTTGYLLKPCCRLGSYPLDCACFCSKDESLIVMAFLVTQAIAGLAHVLTMASQHGYQFQNAAARTFGMLLMFNLSFTLLPINRIPFLVAVFGTSFERAVKLHRWHGRLTILMVVGHFILSLISTSGDLGGMFSNDEFTFFGSGYLWGSLGGLCLGFMMFTSLQCVRRKYFEVFFYSHFVFLAAFVFSVLHVSRFVYFLLVPAGLYLLDKLLRFIRGLVPAKTVSAHVTEDGIAVLRLAFTKLQASSVFGGSCRPWEPGQYYFLNVPQLSLLEWHPISIACSTTKARASANLTDQFDTEFFIKPPITPQACTSDSWAGRLVGRIRTGEKVSVRLDGPYGSLQLNPHRYEVVSLIGGGVGLTPMLSLFGDLLHSAAASTVRLVWVVRSLKELSAFVPTIQAFASTFPGKDNRCCAVAVVYMTRATPQDQASAKIAYPDVTFELGRPEWGPWLGLDASRPGSEGFKGPCNPNDLELAVKQGPSSRLVSVSRFKQGVAVLACGPAPLVEALCDFSAKHGYHFHDETFFL
eukprot:CAMPEP_0175088436 /NCGR_PEP_ID=MMETSP0086_2-20121207/249_1 /TAXON_ID=136419 /ORGANISM="Unknown Unknown, Strain D1" /LENGTH=729 /DNA_ID=CAMNT_0016360873 /DNA_START=149 /DNA_END=2341 /DNA_ORIENTATION=-